MPSYPNRCQHLKTSGAVQIACAAPQPVLLLPQALPGRAHPSERRPTPSRHGQILPAGARRRQLHPDVPHADHAPAAHRADRAQNRQPPSLCAANGTNLRQTNFKPFVHEVILDPRDAAESILVETHLWDDEDFEEEVEEEEVDGVEQEIRPKEEEAAEKARFVARWEAKKDIEARERAANATRRKRSSRAGSSRIPDTGWSAATAVCSPNNDRKKKIPRRPPQPSPHSRSTKSPPPAPHRCAKKLMT
jgi:hypothetical protein